MTIFRNDGNLLGVHPANVVNSGWNISPSAQTAVRGPVLGFGHLTVSRLTPSVGFSDGHAPHYA